MIIVTRVCTCPSNKLALAASLGLLALCPSLDTGVKLPAAPAVAPSPSFAGSALRKAAESFVENRGQWDAQAQFLARSPGVDSWVTERGVVYDFHESRVQGSGDMVQGDGSGIKNQKSKINNPPPSPIKNQQSKITNRRGHVVRMEFVGGRPSPSKGEGLLEGKYNYFVGDESKWASNVPRYSEVRSERVYDGIEARWYFDQGRPRYDLIVAPGADPAKIQMRFEGATGVSGGKSLKLATSLGEVEHKGLFAYQKVGGATKQVPASFVVRGNVASFELGSYDRSKPLVIDPLVWSTFLGGAASDLAYSVALDASGGAVVAGLTQSTDFPTTTGAYDQTHNAGANDAFVTKLSPDGSSLAYSTFLGGAGTDEARSVALDASGGAVVAGYTNSADFPTTAGAFDQTHNGGNDAFVSKLSSDGSTLSYSTFLGSAGDDVANSVALDASGGAVVAGYTNSAGFPTSAGAFDQTHNGGNDAFVSKLSPNGSSLSYSTFLGGVGDEIAYSVALDASGGAVVAGSTFSTGFPTTAGAYNETHNGGNDAFVSKLSPDGSSLAYSTFLGGTGADVAFAVALDASGYAVVAGLTQSTGFPTTAGAHDQTYNGNTFDVFVSKLSPGGSALAYSTFLGGAGVDWFPSVALNTSGGAVVAGYTSSTDFPTTAGAYDEAHNGGTNDTFVSNLQLIPVPLSVSVPKNSFIGGFSVPLTLALTVPWFEDVVVALSTDTPGKVFVSQTKVRAGKAVKTFGVRTETVLADTPVEITATLNGVSKTVSFTLKPGGLQSLKLKPTSLSSLELGTGTVKLSAPAPVDGRIVDLESNNAPLLYVPTNVRVPEGLSEAVFPTFAGFVASTSNVTVKARLGTTIKTATLTVNP